MHAPPAFKPLLIVALTFALISSTGCLSPQQQSVAAYLNQDRRAHRVAALPIHGQLSVKAQAWAEHLAKVGDLSHSVLDHGVPNCWKTLGENVGYAGSIAQAEQAFMNSPGHKRNIVDPIWDWVGVGYVYRNGLVWVVQVFMAGC